MRNQSLGNASINVDKIFLLTPVEPRPVEFTNILVSLAKENDVGFIVKLSALGAEADPGIITTCLHIQAEIVIEQSGIPFTFLRPNSFMQNFINFHTSIIKNNNASIFQEEVNVNIGALKKFTADLSGKSEVPPVDTKATGTAQFQISADGKQIDYELNVIDLNNFMMAHIHLGKSGENGPHIVMLSMGKGRITSGDLQGPLSGEQLSDLAKLMQDRNTYVNVHTQQNQNGEIRGQIAGS